MASETSGQVVIVATLRIAEGRGEAVERELLAMIDAVHAEEGCITYAFHRSQADPDEIVVIERWALRSDADRHADQPHVREYERRAEHLYREPLEMRYFDPIPGGDPAKGLI